MKVFEFIEPLALILKYAWAMNWTISNAITEDLDQHNAYFYQT